MEYLDATFVPSVSFFGSLEIIAATVKFIVSCFVKHILYGFYALTNVTNATGIIYRFTGTLQLTTQEIGDITLSYGRKKPTGYATPTSSTYITCFPFEQTAFTTGGTPNWQPLFVRTATLSIVQCGRWSPTSPYP
ncbi:hypothetical protein C7974DRAFT_381153 [Boeremia exigua]|uniref:uncharacterized protein n=1 Tax=Boeremia exigua TaxID=749465 RepID=UPI001E8D6860|nr:uncharacterized protein C7974DRAFT_381153 [Boeremia exigua]KAH6612626.1 hypothetical protein C7974DRAFT_381153 [Boeremia exigua]